MGTKWASLVLLKVFYLCALSVAVAEQVPENSSGFYFHSLGDVAIITGEANFVVKNNLLDACLLVRQTVVALRNLSESSGDPSIEQTYQMAMILDESLTTLIPTVHLRREWRTLLHCTDKGLVFHGEELFGTIKCTHRGKRQIGLLLAGIGVVASLYMTGKNAVKLRAIHRESDKARGERKHLAEAVTANFHRTEELRDRIQEVVDSTATSLDHINQRQTATEMYLLAQQAFNHMDRVVRSARRGEFEPTSLRESDFIEAIGRMREDADKKGMILNLEDGEELSQMAVLKTSYQIYEDGTFVAVTHIPMTNLNMQMSLYKVTSLPVKTDSGWFGVESKYQYIAVSKSRSSWYAPLTEMMYRACVGFGHGLSCRVPYYYTDSEIVEGESDGRCMFALYSGRSRDIKKACRIGRRVLDEVAVHLELRRYAIFTGERKRELILQCPGKEDRTMPAAEVHHVTLNSSCSATTGSIVIPGFESIDEEVEVNFAYQQLDVLTRLANETKETLNRYIKRGAISFDKHETEELEFVEREKDEFGKKIQANTMDKLTQVFTIIGVAAVVLLIIAVATCCYRKCCRKEKVLP